MPVEKQVLIALKYFSIYENCISLHNIADWIGIRYDMVDFITWRVIITILDINLRDYHIR